MKFSGIPVALTATFLSAALLGCGGGDGASGAAGASVGTIKVTSNRADLISGGDALIEIVVSPGIDASKLKVEAAGKDVTSAFAVREDGRYMGLVSGLGMGSNVVSASLPDGSVSKLGVTNHSISGPVFYGPQTTSWRCAAGASDTSCNRPISYAYFYVSSNPALKGFQKFDTTNPPGDVALTTNDQGRTVPFVVRVETGVQDRDFYNVAVLFDPTQEWSRWKPQSGWNRKLLIVHGGGCGSGFEQSNALASTWVMDATALGRGFAVTSINLNNSGHNCNIALQAEATVMAKEHIIESYGDIAYTMGYGNSGGALAQQWLANAYPGLYNGIIVGASFPDAGTAMTEIEDCALLVGYFGRTSTAWSSTEKAAASGHLSPAVCAEWVNVYGFQRNFIPYGALPTDDPDRIPTVPGGAPTAIGGCDIPAGQRYEPTFNRPGVRCTLWDVAPSVFGKGSDGFADRPWSNVGVQYGLSALLAGRISTGQFVDLNASVGSHTADYDFQARRSAATGQAVANAYRSGWVNQANGMNEVAIIDMRSGDIGGIHHQYRSWVVRARLDREFGGHANQAIWFKSGTPAEAYTVMDKWLSAVRADASGAALSAKIAAHRPAAANDRCEALDGTGLTMAQCTGVADGSSRMGAGAPMTDDVLDCQLIPVDRSRYGSVTFSDAQWEAMKATFPSGVCDYSKAGEGQQATQFWQRYIDTAGNPIVGGQPMGPSP